LYYGDLFSRAGEGSSSLNLSSVQRFDVHCKEAIPLGRRRSGIPRRASQRRGEDEGSQMTLVRGGHRKTDEEEGEEADITTNNVHTRTLL